MIDSNVNQKQQGHLLLFWDYDTQWGADRSRSPGGAKQWGELEFESTVRLLEILDEYNTKACFAVVGAAAEEGSHPYHDPIQVRELHQAGHEVASHSYKHEWLPGLTPQLLMESLTKSKESLEACISAPVQSFVPPFNQPFDCWQRLSISYAERKECKGNRIDLGTLCKCLKNVGYKFTRVSYRPVWFRAADALLRKRYERPSHIEKISGLSCLRVNSEGGFGPNSLEVARMVAKLGGIAVVYGHPHSLGSDGNQGEKNLLAFLDGVRPMIQEGRLKVVLPRDLL